jgi:CPA2 family monovalent cation:H+ antiporter-2
LAAETEFDHRVVAEVVPMRNMFATLFFVSVGMLIDPAFVLANLHTVLGLAAFIVLAKALLTLLAVLPFQLGTRTTAFAFPRADADRRVQLSAGADGPERGGDL